MPTEPSAPWGAWAMPWRQNAGLNEASRGTPPPSRAQERGTAPQHHICASLNRAAASQEHKPNMWPEYMATRTPGDSTGVRRGGPTAAAETPATPCEAKSLQTHSRRHPGVPRQRCEQEIRRPAGEGHLRPAERPHLWVVTLIPPSICHPSSTEEETEVQRGPATCPTSPGWFGAGLGYKFR